MSPSPKQTLDDRMDCHAAVQKVNQAGIISLDPDKNRLETPTENKLGRGGKPRITGCAKMITKCAAIRHLAVSGGVLRTSPHKVLSPTQIVPSKSGDPKFKTALNDAHDFGSLAHKSSLMTK